MKSNELVVIKDSSNEGTDRGFVRILYELDANKNIQLPNHKIYPSGTIWISKGYETIDERFDHGEPFVVIAYETEPESGSLHHHHHWSTNSSTRLLEGNAVLPVIATKLPNRATGEIEITGIVPKGPFFVEDAEFIYGPFQTHQSGDEITASAYNSQQALELKTQHIAKMEADSIAELELLLPVPSFNGLNKLPGVKGYIKSLTEIKAIYGNQIEQVDFISDQQLISYYRRSDFGKSIGLPKKTFDVLKSGVDKIQRKEKTTRDDDRLKRFRGLMDRYLNYTDIGSELIDDFLQSSDGKVFLTSYCQDNPGKIEHYIVEHKEQKQKLTTEINQLKRQKQIEEETYQTAIQKAKEETAKIIEDIRTKGKEEAQEERNKLAAELEKKIKQQEDDLKKLETVISEKQSMSNSLDTIDKIKSEIAYYQRREQELKSAVDAQQKQLKSPDLPANLAETQALLELLSGRIFNKEDQTVNFYTPDKNPNQPESGEDFANTLIALFDDGGRSFSYEEMINLLITIQQSFLTVLKGLPGSGKTSTVIRLADAMKLTSPNSYQPSSAFLNIPVSRGWVSGRDFLGFYNSLKNTFQPAKTGLYQFIKAATDKTEDPMRLVLLDEANLSQMEYYFSEFLAMCDQEGRKRPLDTANPEDRYLYIDQNLRFIATINSDHTTETLSPRLCDRVPVISMDSKLHSDDVISVSNILQSGHDGAVSHEVLESFFGRPSTDEDKEDDITINDFCNLMEQYCGQFSDVNDHERKQR